MAYSYTDFKTATGPRLELSRFQTQDIPQAAAALINPGTWFCVQRGLDTPDKFEKGIGEFLEKQNRGEFLVVLARLKDSKEIVAMSTYHDADPAFTHVEIGFTWIAEKWQRTFVNSELKLLMLTHAFEEMKVVRVQFAVDPINEKSNKAMLRLGATLEGTFRKWRFLPPQDKGDRNIYSILDTEWPAIRTRLQGGLESSTY